MPKYILDTEYDYDFSLLAISAHVPDYKVCIEINRLLNIELVRDISIELSTKNTGTPLLFSCFSYQDEEEQSEFILLSNKSSNTVAASKKLISPPSLFDEKREDIKFLLVPELAQTDFLFILKADNHQQEIYNIQNKLKTITFTLSIQTIDVETLSSKKNLII
ncbi:MAG TPA: IPExxxVDY family protein [Bacteroidia bacterium]|nr:IPExxxVDY family protein [Bacteroidia bacterium]